MKRTPVRLPVILALAVAGVLVAVAPPARAATFTPTRFDDPPPGTCDPADCSLREAVRAANSLPGPDTIALAAGTYTLSLATTLEDAAADGDLDVTDSLTINGLGPSTTTVDGNGFVTGDRVFEVDPPGAGTGPTVTFEGLTIRGGRATDIFEDGGGMAIRNQAKVTLRDAVITGNSALDGEGGAIYARDDASLSVVRTLFSGNFADGDGGAITVWNDATMSITDSVLSSNHAMNNGGAIHTRNVVVSTITRTTLSGNVSEAEGGAIHQFNNTVLNLVGSTVSGNSAVDHGGGLYFRNEAQGTVSNSTISGNLAGESGGGIEVGSLAAHNPTVDIRSATITANRADGNGDGLGDGGGIAEIGTGTATLTNTIVAGNADPTSDPDCFGDATSQGSNLVGIVSPGCAFSLAAGDKTGTVTTPLDPRLGPLATNGGPTQTHALLAGSTAIDAAGPGAPPADQRGAPRAGPPDIGAYELVRCQGRVVNRVGTGGNDALAGTGGKDGILGLGGKDQLKGKGGADGLCGGPGKDTLRGGAGKDRLNGGPGKDICLGQAGRDKARACEKERKIP